MIQHHFKLVWMFHQTNLLTNHHHLRMVTEEQNGYDMWRDAVVPLSATLGHDLASQGDISEPLGTWPNELICLVKEAGQKG